MRRGASAQQLREAFDRIRRSFPPTSQTYLAAAQAYAVLGDPRLRAEYDAGRVVGSGAGLYYEPPTSSSSRTATAHGALQADSAPDAYGGTRRRPSFPRVLL